MFAVGALKASGTYGAPYQPAIGATAAYGSRRDGRELCPLVSSSYGPCNEGRGMFSLTFLSRGTGRVFLSLIPARPSWAAGDAFSILSRLLAAFCLNRRSLLWLFDR